MTKEKRIAVRLDTPTKAALERAAKADARSVSAMAEKIIVEWLKSHAGYTKRLAKALANAAKGGTPDAIR